MKGTVGLVLLTCKIYFLSLLSFNYFDLWKDDNPKRRKLILLCLWYLVRNDTDGRLQSTSPLMRQLKPHVFSSRQIFLLRSFWSSRVFFYTWCLVLGSLFVSSYCQSLFTLQKRSDQKTILGLRKNNILCYRSYTKSYISILFRRDGK